MSDAEYDKEIARLVVMLLGSDEKDKGMIREMIYDLLYEYFFGDD